MRRRNSQKQASGSMLAMMIIAASVLAFLPIRVTIGAGSGRTTVLDGALMTLHGILTFIGLPGGIADLVFPSSTSQMAAEAGTHYAIDALSVFTNSTMLARFITRLAGNTPPFAQMAQFFSLMDYLILKIPKATIDFENSNGSIEGLLPPIGSGPFLTSSSSSTVELRIVLISVTIAGYRAPSLQTNNYGEASLSALNPVLSVSFDRLFIDLFVDPVADAAVYIVSAEMTVYQAAAMLLITASLGN